jgi:uncharacterized membrane protein
MIANWWLAHHRLFRFIVRYDDILVSLNMLLLVEVAVMPFVLKVFVDYDQTQVAVLLFDVLQIALALTVGVLWRYASHRHRLIVPETPEAILRYFGLRTLITPAVFLLSIGLSFVNVTAAELVWIGVFGARWMVRFTFSRPDRTALAP